MIEGIIELTKTPLQLSWWENFLDHYNAEIWQNIVKLADTFFPQKKYPFPFTNN